MKAPEKPGTFSTEVQGLMARKKNKKKCVLVSFSRLASETEKTMYKKYVFLFGLEAFEKSLGGVWFVCFFECGFWFGMLGCFKLVN